MANQVEKAQCFIWFLETKRATSYGDALRARVHVRPLLGNLQETQDRIRQAVESTDTDPLLREWDRFRYHLDVTSGLPEKNTLNIYRLIKTNFIVTLTSFQCRV
jgi:hypothetical protein